MKLWEMTATDLLAGFAAGVVSPVEAMRATLDRAEAVNPKLNAFFEIRGEQAMAAARASEARWMSGRPVGTLDGVPVSVKDSVAAEGWPMWRGTRARVGTVSTHDAPPTARLKEAGAILFAKTTMPDYGLLASGVSSAHGVTRNPWNTAMNTGGSSSGAASSVAAGAGALTIGSDLAGSLRTPAHFCGVYAHKPTLGLAPTRGMVAPPGPAMPIDLDLAVVGPMARTARDLTLLLAVMAGPDPLTQGLAYDVALPAARHERSADFRVLVIEDHPLIPTGSAVRAAVNRVAEALVDEGARVQRRSPLLPDPTEAATLYMLLMLSNAAAGLRVDVY